MHFFVVVLIFQHRSCATECAWHSTNEAINILMIRRIPLNVNPRLSFEVSNMLSSRPNLIRNLRRWNLSINQMQYQSLPINVFVVCVSPPEIGPSGHIHWKYVRIALSQRGKKSYDCDLQNESNHYKNNDHQNSSDRRCNDSSFTSSLPSLFIVECVLLFLLTIVVVFAVVFYAVCIHCAVCTRSKKGRKMLKCNKFWYNS